MPGNYTPEELEHHLGYEIDMLNRSYGLILNIDGLLSRAGASCVLRQAALNSMKENFCLHGRGLLEFFTKKATTTNSAASFAPNFKPGMAPKGLQQKLNNQIAHLMNGRTDDRSKKIHGGDRDELFRWIARELQRWLPLRDTSYSTIMIPQVDLSLIPLTVSSTQGATNQIITT